LQFQKTLKEILIADAFWGTFSILQTLAWLISKNIDFSRRGGSNPVTTLAPAFCRDATFRFRRQPTAYAGNCITQPRRSLQNNAKQARCFVKVKGKRQGT